VGYNGLLVKNNWAASTATVFQAGNDYVGGAFASYLIVRGDGLVGIGTATPSALLHVVQPGTGPQIAARFDNSDTSATSEARIVFGEGGNWLQGIGGPYNGGLPALAFSVNASSNTWAERMRITNAGRVGIGITGPGAALDVEMASASTPNGQVLWGDGAGHQGALYADGTNIGIGSINAEHLIFYTGNSAAQMTLTTAGALGIGTSSPAANAKLHVVGGGLAVGASAVPFSAGDIACSRESAPTSGAIYFGSSGANYIFFNGSQWVFSPSLPASNWSTYAVSLTDSSGTVPLNSQQGWYLVHGNYLLLYIILNPSRGVSNPQVSLPQAVINQSAWMTLRSTQGNTGTNQSVTANLLTIGQSSSGIDNIYSATLQIS
jgi:hypothetical protein